MRIDATPHDTMYDEPIRIRLSGFLPLRGVTIEASAVDGMGRRWASSATFLTDASGEVDLEREAPHSGPYRTADATGLLWSMQLDPAVVERGPFTAIRPDAVHIGLSVEMDGNQVADAQLVRRFMKAGDTREEVREDGLIASFFHPADGPHPGVILLGGSGGGLSEDQPALLASHGYAVLSLGYFAMAGLPRDLMEIPLEYFERAIAWMKRHRAVRADKIAVIGASRGGELALLLGATFSEIKAVVAYVPSGIVWPGIGGTAEPRAAWTRGGHPVPFIEPAPQDPSTWSKRPVAMTPWFIESMKNRASAESAAIAVERINGPVLMFSGTDDQMWPSLNLADFAVQRMMERKFPHPYEHVSYAGAGHFIRFPYTPVISEIFHPVVKTPMALGGTAEANHVANLDSWHRCLSFLAKFMS